jgi:H+/Cl- antiporter ClcA
VSNHPVEEADGTDRLPIAPSLTPALIAIDVPVHSAPVDRRVVYISLLAAIVGVISALLAQVLLWLIRLLTNISFHGQFSSADINHPLAHPQPWMIVVPVIGAFVIGLMLRYGSRAVAGHGIPEAIEQVLTNQSRIPAKMTFLKPVSAAISIGTGAPYGAEGPIIATGGAIGSLIGQVISTTDHERKVLLAAGASAGIATAFNSPIAAVLLAVELLLFEFRPRSLIPVGVASVIAASIHIAFEGRQPFFSFAGNLQAAPSHLVLALYLAIGCVVGIGSVVLTRSVYHIEKFFEDLPIHWMWHPAIGAVAVGVIGYFVPQTLGSGYYNIDDLLQQNLALKAVAILGIMKFLSWTISLGSGTAGGTLAPVFTIGGALGAICGAACARCCPQAHLNVGMAALVGMVGIFAGASRALLTSVVFAIETTMQPAAILPALGGCIMAYLVSCLLMRYSIMTEKMVRHGVRVPEEYQPDFLDQILVRDVASKSVVALRSDQTVEDARQWIKSGAGGTKHQGFPILDSQTGLLIGVLTRRDLLDASSDGQSSLHQAIRQPPRVVYDDCTLRDAADHMVNHDIGRLPVVQRSAPGKVIGMITRSDLLSAHRVRLRDDLHRRNVHPVRTLVPSPGTPGDG